MIPIRVVVINLDRRPDRLAAFQQRWQAAAPGVEFERIPGVDVPADPLLGCKLAHVAALRSGGGPVLVLEDDAWFAPDFRIDLPTPPAGWSLLRLGGIARAVTPLSGPWQSVQALLMAHAYVAADPAELAERLLSHPHTSPSYALSGPARGHYRLHPSTVGQAASLSDISGEVRESNEIWR